MLMAFPLYATKTTNWSNGMLSVIVLVAVHGCCSPPHFQYALLYLVGHYGFVTAKRRTGGFVVDLGGC